MYWLLPLIYFLIYYDGLFLSVALQYMTTLIWTIAIENFLHTIIMIICKLLEFRMIFWTHFTCDCKCYNWRFLHTIINHKLHVEHCNSQFLYALLILLALIWTITFVNFLGIILNVNFYIYYCTHYNQQIITVLPLIALQGLTTFLCAIAIDNFCMH